MGKFDKTASTHSPFQGQEAPLPASEVARNQDGHRADWTFSEEQSMRRFREAAEACVVMNMASFHYSSGFENTNQTEISSLIGFWED